MEDLRVDCIVIILTIWEVAILATVDLNILTHHFAILMVIFAEKSACIGTLNKMHQCKMFPPGWKGTTDSSFHHRVDHKTTMDILVQ